MIEGTCFKLLCIPNIPSAFASLLTRVSESHNIRALTSQAFTCHHQHQCGLLFCFELEEAGPSSGSELESITKILITERCSQ